MSVENARGWLACRAAHVHPRRVRSSGRILAMASFACLATCALLVACQAPAESGAPCARAADCAEPLTCAFGRCRAECLASRDCALGSRCIVGPTAGVCALDEENHCDATVCPAPLSCVVDQCRTGCAGDADCVAGPCVAGTCVEPSRGSGAPVARRVSSAFFSDWFGTAYGTQGMSRMGYEVSTGDVRDGELLLLIGCVDNGSPTVWPNPMAPGFTQLVQTTWGTDGQTCVVDWRIASHEPPSYAGLYGPNIASASAVIALVAVDGARTINPITTYASAPDSAAPADPVVASSAGLTTTVPDTLVLYAASADWTCNFTHTVSASAPAGFATILHQGDHGDAGCDWTWLAIETTSVHDPGPTGPITGTQAGTPGCAGTAWTAVIAIAP